MNYFATCGHILSDDVRTPLQTPMPTNDDAPPAYATISLDFWGVKLPHIAIGVDDVRISLQDAVKAFSGINDSGQLSNKMKEIMAPYKNGARPIERRTRGPNATFGFPNLGKSQI